MNKRTTALRFDHREIAVIFSLFIFVSLLMFTVGILVGKGLAQAKYEGMLAAQVRLAARAAAKAAREEGQAERTLATTAASQAPEAKPTTVPLVSALAVNPEPAKQEAPAAPKLGPTPTAPASARATAKR